MPARLLQEAVGYMVRKKSYASSLHRGRLSGWKSGFKQGKLCCTGDPPPTYIAFYDFDGLLLAPGIDIRRHQQARAQSKGERRVLRGFFFLKKKESSHAADIGTWDRQDGADRLLPLLAGLVG